MSESHNWVCDICGKPMPHFYAGCPSCEKKQKVKDEQEGRIKRAKAIVVGDVICPRFSFKINSITVETVDITSKGKGHMGGEYVFQPEQWVDVVQSPVETMPVA
jgi:predicted ATP-dependent serine protease